MYQIRTSEGQFDGIENLEHYILKKCSEHKAEKRAFAFALIVYDFNDPHISMILENENYFNALDYTSGHFLTVFHIHSEYIKYQSDRAKKSKTMRIELSVEKVNAPANISPKFIGEKLINNNSLPSPSVIFFNTSKYIITDYTIAKLRENEIEKGFNELLSVIKTAVEGLNEIKEENRDNEKEIFNLLKQSIEGSEFWKNAKSGFDKLMKIKDFFLFWKV
ncbi:MAG: hypothetical protein V4561_02225 [Bacteroidota bacterium]